MYNAMIYSYDRYNKTISTGGFTPTQNNWLINANNGEQNIYFQNLTSYNNWSTTCCGESASNIRDGFYGGYQINYNKL